MAKSERKSKWKRKMRAIKRVKNTPKELVRLNKCLAKGEIDIADMEQIAIVRETNSIEASISEVDRMQTDDSSKKFNKRTMRDVNGHYPEWMNQRSIKKIKKRLDKTKKKKNKNKK